MGYSTKHLHVDKEKISNVFIQLLNLLVPLVKFSWDFRIAVLYLLHKSKYGNPSTDIFCHVLISAYEKSLESNCSVY